MPKNSINKNILVVGTKERKDALYNAITNNPDMEKYIVNVDMVDSKRGETIAKHVRSRKDLDLVIFFNEYVSAAPEFKRLCNRDAGLYGGKTAVISKIGKPVETEISNSVDYSSHGLLIGKNITDISNLLDQN